MSGSRSAASAATPMDPRLRLARRHLGRERRRRSGAVEDAEHLGARGVGAGGGESAGAQARRGPLLRGDRAERVARAPRHGRHAPGVALPDPLEARGLVDAGVARRVPQHAEEAALRELARDHSAALVGQEGHRTEDLLVAAGALADRGEQRGGRLGVGEVGGPEQQGARADPGVEARIGVHGGAADHAAAAIAREEQLDSGRAQP